MKNLKSLLFLFLIIFSSFNLYAIHFKEEATTVNFKKQKPEKITILWDKSFSLDGKNLNKELDFLNNYLNYIKNVKIEVISFAHQRVERRKFNVKRGKWDILRAYLNSIVYDGSTLLPNGFRDIDSDEILLFSDGFFYNMKRSVSMQPRNLAPIYCIVSTDRYEIEELNTLAVETYGNIINLNTVSMDKALSLVKDFGNLQFLDQSENVLAKTQKIKNSSENPINDGFKEKYKSLSAEEAYNKYLEYRNSYGVSYNFFIETFMYFQEIGESAKAFQILSNIMELFPENAEALSTLAFIYDAFDKKIEAYNVYRYLQAKGDPRFITFYGLINHLRANGEYEASVSLLKEYLKSDTIKQPILKQFVTNEIMSLFPFSKAMIGTDLENYMVDEKSKVRVVFQWNLPDFMFDLSVNGPTASQNIEWDHTDTASASYMAFEKQNGFYLYDINIPQGQHGKWQLKVIPKNYKNEIPVYFKITIYRNFGLESEVKEETYYTPSDLKNKEILKELIIE